MATHAKTFRPTEDPVVAELVEAGDVEGLREVRVWLEKTDQAMKKTRGLVTHLAKTFQTSEDDVIEHLSDFAGIAQAARNLDDVFLISLDRGWEDGRELVRLVTKLKPAQLRVRLSRAKSRLKRPKRYRAK